MDDARLRTVEEQLLGVTRIGDVGGWEIPAIYLDVLRGGPVEALAGVVIHNEKDVRSLGLLLAHVERRLAARERRAARRRGRPGRPGPGLRPGPRATRRPWSAWTTRWPPGREPGPVRRDAAGAARPCRSSAAA